MFKVVGLTPAGLKGPSSSPGPLRSKAVHFITVDSMSVWSFKNLFMVGEMAQWVRALVCKHEYLSSNPQNPRKKDRYGYTSL